MIVSGSGSTSIVVEGTTTESTDVDKMSDKEIVETKINGQSPKDSEEVYIVINKSTNVQKKVS